MNQEQQLIDAIADCYADPLRFVLQMYPWGEKGTPLEQFQGPDEWQIETLGQIGKAVSERRFDGRNAVPPIRMAISSGHGIGKSTITAWIVNWIMSTRPNAVGTVTANTFPQLETKTWAAIKKWTALSANAHWWKVTDGAMRHEKHRDTWYCTPQTCKEENSESFAGQHAASSTSFYIMDEASGIPDKIYEVAEGGLTDGEPMIFLFGNPTKNTGKFYRVIFGSETNRWMSRIIDSRDVAISNKALIEEWRNDYGENSDWFRVRVRGLHPRASDVQFIDSERVEAAQERIPFHFPDDPLVVGLDVARGGDDNCVFWFRRGADAASIPPIVIPGEQVRDSTSLITRAVHVMDTKYGGVKPAMMFVDGTGIGGPIVDRIHQMGYRNVVEVQFGGRAPDDRYGNMRAYMWAQMRDWLLKGSIPKGHRVAIEATIPGYRHDSHDRLFLEKKEEMKKRGEASPDCADSLALTFARPVGPALALRQEALIINGTAETSWMA